MHKTTAFLAMDIRSCQTQHVLRIALKASLSQTITALPVMIPANNALDLILQAALLALKDFIILLQIIAAKNLAIQIN